MFTSGMLIVAIQLYCPPSDKSNGENRYVKVSLCRDAKTVPLGDTSSNRGFTTRPFTTLAEHCNDVFRPAT